MLKIQFALNVNSMQIGIYSDLSPVQMWNFPNECREYIVLLTSIFSAQKWIHPDNHRVTVHTVRFLAKEVFKSDEIKQMILLGLLGLFMILYRAAVRTEI